MYTRSLVVLVLYVFFSQLATPASAAEVDGDGPEAVIRGLYRLISFDAGSLPDYVGIRKLLADDAVLLMRATTETIELINADEFIQRIQRKIDESGLVGLDLLCVPNNINCRITDVTAYCVSVVDTRYPGRDLPPVNSTDLTTLERQDGRWLATSSALFVPVPDIEPPSILSAPFKAQRPNTVQLDFSTAVHTAKKPRRLICRHA